MYRLCIRSAKRKKPNVIQKKQQTSFRRGKTFPAPSVVLGVLTFPFPSRHSRSSPCCARSSTARSRACHDTGPARCRVVA
ncbi:MC150R [Molluscum contagiosum virus]|uniref:MC150R n=1 Tax=Molluscum contagiosum virus TaxID=10279 RepID=A0A858A4J8_9POXV|nr:MC150R [Molluscum contagiosum virus]QHW16713.1 MC150R [Molluscum contagiosum virus]QHW17432.1 MC150R [Molluscum contagiosum virus]QHW17605.1 MC150R [Molluscum contagiosum virus]QHW17779.1 MC150R [Molluscum contagiosum virus]